MYKVIVLILWDFPKYFHKCPSPWVIPSPWPTEAKNLCSENPTDLAGLVGLPIHTATWPWHHWHSPSNPQPAVNMLHCSTMFYQYTRASTFQTFSFYLFPMFWQETDFPTVSPPGQWIQKKNTPWCTAAHPGNHDKIHVWLCDSVTLSFFKTLYRSQDTGLSLAASPDTKAAKQLFSSWGLSRGSDNEPHQPRAHNVGNIYEKTWKGKAQHNVATV